MYNYTDTVRAVASSRISLDPPPMRQAVGELLVQRPGIGETWLQEGDSFTCTRDRQYTWNGAALVEQANTVPQGLLAHMTKLETEGYYQKQYRLATEKMAKLEQELKEASRDRDSVGIGTHALREELAAKEEKYRELGKENAYLRQEVADLTDLNQSMRDHVDRVNQENHKLREKNATQARMIIERDKRLGEWQPVAWDWGDLPPVLKPRIDDGWVSVNHIRDILHAAGESNQEEEEKMNVKKIFVAAVVNVETDVATLQAVVSESAEDARIAAALAAGINLEDFKNKYEVVLLNSVGITKQPRGSKASETAA